MNEHLKQADRITTAQQSCRAGSLVKEFRTVYLYCEGAKRWTIDGKLIALGPALVHSGEVGTEVTVMADDNHYTIKF